MVPPPDEPVTPPTPLAVRLVLLAASEKDRDTIVGDLTEQFEARAARNDQRAKRWLWSEALRSLPPLLLLRMNPKAMEKIGVFIGLVIGAIIFTRYWDLFIARGAAQQFQRAVQPESFTPARMVYFVIHALGYTLTGAAAHALLATRGNSFAQFALTRLAPVFLIVSAPALFDLFSGADTYPLRLRLLQFTLTAAALLAGAGIAALIRPRGR